MCSNHIGTTISKSFSSTGTLTLESELTFGKYLGCTVYEALSDDPKYVAWLYVTANKPISEEIKKLLVSRLLELLPVPKQKSTTKSKLFLPPSYEEEYFEDAPF